MAYLCPRMARGRQLFCQGAHDRSVLTAASRVRVSDGCVVDRCDDSDASESAVEHLLHHVIAEARATLHVVSAGAPLPVVLTEAARIAPTIADRLRVRRVGGPYRLHTTHHFLLLAARSRV